MTNRVFLITFCLLHSFSATAAEPLGIAVARSPLSLPLYIAEHKGYFVANAMPRDIVKLFNIVDNYLPTATGNNI